MHFFMGTKFLRCRSTFQFTEYNKCAFSVNPNVKATISMTEILNYKKAQGSLFLPFQFLIVPAASNLTWSCLDRFPMEKLSLHAIVPFTYHAKHLLLRICVFFLTPDLPQWLPTSAANFAFTTALLLWEEQIKKQIC